MRFEAEMRAAAVSLSLSGVIVTGPFVNMKHPDPRWATDELADPIKASLDRLHLAKIDLADEVVVVAPGGYIGDSTRAEIAYAEQAGKSVRYWGEKADAEVPQPGSTAALYLELVDTYGHCICSAVACYGDFDGDDDIKAGDECQLCHHLDPEWPCPAEEDADYPTPEGRAS